MSDLVDELRALSPRARNAVLAALSATEQRAVEALLGESPVSQDKIAIVSPGMAAHIAAARRGEGPMTAAARQALVRAADAVVGTVSPATGGDRAGSSLVDAMGGMLARRRA